jgi:hypothetical protein
VIEIGNREDQCGRDAQPQGKQAFEDHGVHIQFP